MTPLEWLAQTRATITGRLIDALVAAFYRPGTWHEADARRFGPEAAHMVRGAQRTLADAVAAAFTEITREQFPGQDVAPISLRDRDVTDLRGVDPADVYQRSFRDIWEDLGGSTALELATEKAARRVEHQADEDLQQAYASAWQQSMQAPPKQQQPTYWLRVPQGDYTCALCLIASTQRYNIKIKNRLHPACDCRVVPMYDKRPQGHVLNEELLERVHDAVEAEFGFSERSGRGRVDYRELLIEMVEDHGELGPMLVHPRRKAKKLLENLQPEADESAD